MSVVRQLRTVDQLNGDLQVLQDVIARTKSVPFDVAGHPDLQFALGTAEYAVGMALNTANRGEHASHSRAVAELAVQNAWETWRRVVAEWIQQVEAPLQITKIGYLMARIRKARLVEYYPDILVSVEDIEIRIAIAAFMTGYIAEVPQMLALRKGIYNDLKTLARTIAQLIEQREQEESKPASADRGNGYHPEPVFATWPGDELIG